MMDNEEPILSNIANLQIAHEGHKLPEQSRVPNTQVPRGFDFEHLIHQWQPMGIRVVMNLPFTGNDKDYLLAIRNGPFIPSNTYTYRDSSGEAELKDGFPDPKQRNLTTMRDYNMFAWNNMTNVTHGYDLPRKVGSDDKYVTITQYDEPPILSSISTMFRRWRGTMHYRLRVVSGFTTQGYVFASVIRNSPSYLQVNNLFQRLQGVKREDSSYRESMINSYVMGDTAMFRHFEFQVPFEYPVPYYDQYAWIGRRTRPAKNFAWGVTPGNELLFIQPFRPMKGEPHGDNYIMIGLRGQIATTVQNSELSFELEYRAGYDFQFADPFLPFPSHFMRPFYQTSKSSNLGGILKVPDPAYKTDGLGFPTKTSDTIVTKQQVKPKSLAADDMTQRLEQSLTADQQRQLEEAKRKREQQIQQGQVAQENIRQAQIRQRELQSKQNARTRGIRSVNDLDGHDEVDSDLDDASVASDVSDLSELGGPRRKSLRNKFF